MVFPFPIRCMSCGNVLADKYLYYKAEVSKYYSKQGQDTEPQRITVSGTGIPQTFEKSVLNTLKINRPCCRTHFLTYVDLQ